VHTEKEKTVRIRLKSEERIFQGTAKQIVQQMKETAQRADHLTLDAYVDWCAQNGAVMGHDVKIEGQDEDARCASLVSEMVRLGIAEKL
jgi:hypothetical protein